jgi:hypothetical protein
MPPDRNHLPPSFWGILSAVAALSAAALVLLPTHDPTQLGIPFQLGPGLAVLLVPPLVILAVACWGQPGMDLGRSAPSRGELYRLLRAKQARESARPDRPTRSTAPSPEPQQPPLRRHRAILVDESEDEEDLTGLLGWLVASHRARRKAAAKPRRGDLT